MTLNALPCYFHTHEIHTSIDVSHANVALLSSSYVLQTSSSASPTLTLENSIDGLYMMIQESFFITNCINQIALTNIVTCLIKFKPSNCRNSFCWHLITNTLMASDNNPIYRYSYGLTQHMAP